MPISEGPKLKSGAEGCGSRRAGGLRKFSLLLLSIFSMVELKCSHIGFIQAYSALVRTNFLHGSKRLAVDFAKFIDFGLS